MLLLINIEKPPISNHSLCCNNCRLICKTRITSVAYILPTHSYLFDCKTPYNFTAYSSAVGFGVSYSCYCVLNFQRWKWNMCSQTQPTDRRVPGGPLFVQWHKYKHQCGSHSSPAILFDCWRTWCSMGGRDTEAWIHLIQRFGFGGMNMYA